MTHSNHNPNPSPLYHGEIIASWHVIAAVFNQVAYAIPRSCGRLKLDKMESTLLTEIDHGFLNYLRKRKINKGSKEKTHKVLVLVFSRKPVDIVFELFIYLFIYFSLFKTENLFFQYSIN